MLMRLVIAVVVLTEAAQEQLPKASKLTDRGVTIVELGVLLRHGALLR
jgi:hypothetical protein